MKRLVRLSTGTAIAVGFGSALLLILLIGAVAWVFSQRVASSLDAITGNEFPCYRHIAALYARQNDIQALFGVLALETEAATRHRLEERIDKQLASLHDDIRAYESFPHGREEQRRWEALRVELMSYVEVALAQRDLEATRDHAMGDREIDKRAIEGLRLLHLRDAASDDLTDGVVAAMNQEAEEYRDEAAHSIVSLRRALLAVVLICSSLTLALAYATHGSVEKAEAARRSEVERALLSRRLQLIARYGSDILLLCDREGRIHEANDRAIDVYGYAREALLALNLRDIVVGVDDQGIAARFQQADAGGIVFDCTHRRHDGSVFPVEVSFSAIEVGGRRYYLGVSRDITERKRVQEADAANRAKSAFLANMSHEIRTPLNAILGYSQVMARDAQLTPHSRRNLEVINRSGEHLLALVNDVLEMSKIQAGRSSVNLGIFDLRRMVRDLEAMFRLRAGGKQLVFRVIGVEAIPRCIVADEGKVRQVLVNLLGNAVKFTARGEVILRVAAVRLGGARLRLSAAVEDTGPGIPAEDLGKLFHHFGQTRSGVQAGAGTGLGLAISREHSRLMGGDIQVTSEVGRGSVFRFEFPAEEASADACAEHCSSTRVLAIAGTGAAPRVLVVDDQEANRDWLRQLLSEIGFEVREAADGLEAVAACQAWRPALVLMDVRMPRMDGHQATRAIRAGEHGDEVVIIAMTAGVFAEDRERARRSGVDDFLGKPLREPEILEKLQAHLGIEYVYREDPGSQRADAISPASDSLAPEALAQLPRTTLQAMRDATWSGDIDRLRSLIAQVEDSTPSVAAALRDLADGFDIEGLHRALCTTETSEVAS